MEGAVPYLYGVIYGERDTIRGWWGLGFVEVYRF